MNRLKCAFWVVALYLGGCTPEKSPIQAEWYYIHGGWQSVSAISPGAPPPTWDCQYPPRTGVFESQSEDKDPHAYLALLNQGDEQIGSIDRVVLNADRGHPNSGQTLAIDCNLDPGQVIVLPLEKFPPPPSGHPACVIPVAVDVHQSGKSELIHAEMSGGLPSSVPNIWQRECGIYPPQQQPRS
jgi:hypothetical protein